MKSEIARIIEADYHEASDTEMWLVELPDRSRLQMKWPRVSFGPALGIKGEIPRNLLADFNRKMVGTSIRLIITIGESRN